MSMPVLYYDERSPPARAVLMLIKMLDINVEYNFIDLFRGDQYKAEYLLLNPLHAVPTMKHNNLLLTDSHTIMLHLCEQYDIKGQLLPKNYEQRMLVMNKLFFNCFYLFAKDSALMSEIASKGYANIDIAYHEQKLNQAYNAMESFLQDHLYMAGEQMTVADIAILTTVSTADMIFKIKQNKWPKLYKWFEQMKTLSEYRINSEGLAKLRDTLVMLGKLQ